MFDNIGGKIKVFAIVSFILGIIASIVFGIICIVLGNQISSNSYGAEKEAGTELVTYGITFLITGCIGSWLGSLTTYGFGELIEQNQIQTTLLQNINRNLNNSPNSAPVNTPNSAPVNTPPQSQRKLPSTRSKTIANGQVRCENCTETYSISEPRCPFCGHQK